MTSVSADHIILTPINDDSGEGKSSRSECVGEAIVRITEFLSQRLTCNKLLFGE